MVEIEWPCPSCDTLFSSDKEMEMHRATCRGKVAAPVIPLLHADTKQSNQDITAVTAAQLGFKPVTPQQLVLTYKYQGKCPQGHAVETLTIDHKNKNKVSVIAFCLMCKYQLVERTVEKL